MPDMDGWSVLQAIKQDAELSRIPVVMMTISDEKQKGITLGASGYLTKPVDRAQLAQLLDRFKTAMPRALVVEDNLTDRDMMRRLLVGEGWEVIVASNGREALDRLKSEDHNLILLDLMMPEMDGFEFLAEFRRLQSSLRRRSLSSLQRTSALRIVAASMAVSNTFCRKRPLAGRISSAKSAI